MADDYYGGLTAIYAGMQEPVPIQLEVFINGMPSNSWAEYTGTNINEMQTTRFDGALTGILETTGNYPLTNWANKFAWDGINKRISGVGTSQGFTIPGGEQYAKQILFDLASNKFTTRWNPTGQKQGHIYDGNCSGFVGDLTFRKVFNELVIWSYNRSTDLWASAYSLAGLPSINTLWAIDCNAAHNSLYCVEQLTGRLVKFDLSTGTRTVVGNYAGVGAYPVMVSIGDKVLFGGGDTSTSFHVLNAAGNVSLVTNSLPVPYDCRGNYRVLPHPSNANKALCFSQSDSTIRELDITTGLFSVVGVIPAEPAMAASVSASLLGLGAVATWRGGGRVAADVTSSKFWIYKV